MDDTTKNLVDAVLSLATLLTVLAAGAWAYFRFSREGAHKPRIEFDLECAFFGPQRGVFVMAFSIYADNKGQLEHRFDEIRLRVRAIRRNHLLEEWEVRRPLLLFPEVVIQRANVVPPEYGYFFVRPGVRQRISYVTSIPAEFSFILARITFRYQRTGDVHTAERAFEIRAEPPNRPPQPTSDADAAS
jgi:hypothetical protein